MAELLRNVTLSSSVCPSCREAADSEDKTLAEWKRSKWGLPGSSARYCDKDCHCILFPVDRLEDFPAIGSDVRLRGDDNTEIRKNIDIPPPEEDLAALMDEWNAKYGKLPPEIYDMPIDDAAAFLIALMRRKAQKV